MKRTLQIRRSGGTRRAAALRGAPVRAPDGRAVICLGSRAAARRS